MSTGWSMVLYACVCVCVCVYDTVGIGRTDLAKFALDSFPLSFSNQLYLQEPVSYSSPLPSLSNFYSPAVNFRSLLHSMIADKGFLTPIYMEELLQELLIDSQK